MKPENSPFAALEQEAYHAYREWPIWLALRERELEALLTPLRDVTASPEARIQPKDKDQ